MTPLKAPFDQLYFPDPAASDVAGGRVMNRTGGAGTIHIGGAVALQFYSEPTEPRTEYLNIDTGANQWFVRGEIVNWVSGQARVQCRIFVVEQNGTLYKDVARTLLTTITGNVVFLQALQNVDTAFGPREMKITRRLRLQMAFTVFVAPLNFDLLCNNSFVSTCLIPGTDQWEQFWFANRRGADRGADIGRRRLVEERR